MSENPGSGGGGGSGGLYFIVGALVVAVFVVGFIAFGGRMPGHAGSSSAPSKVELHVTTPASPGGSGGK